jgi:DNA-binding transcriptional LysR family regulator
LGHLTKAAQVLCVTQPAVTAQVKALESSLGVALFERSSGRIRHHARGHIPKALHDVGQAAGLGSDADVKHGRRDGWRYGHAASRHAPNAS